MLKLLQFYTSKLYIHMYGTYAYMYVSISFNDIYTIYLADCIIQGSYEKFF